MRRFRLVIAIWLARVYTFLARNLKLGGGSSFPGLLARKLEPKTLELLAQQPSGGAVMITGTNGKTTTATLLGEIVDAQGLRYVHNRSGANLIAGLTTAYMAEADLWGRVSGDLAIMEVDEATVPQAAKEIRPGVVVVTNFFRDQLDRYGELDKTVSFIRRGLELLPEGSTVILNADDPLVASLGDIKGLSYVYYGIDDHRHGVGQMHQTADAKYCPRCGTPFTYELYYYAHLGSYQCPKCHFARPTPDIAVTELELSGMQGSEMTIRSRQGLTRVHFALPGLYNVYNALGAIAVAVQLDLSSAIIEQTVPRFRSAFGRMEAVPIKGRLVYLALVKNPVGYNEVLRTFLRVDKEKNFLFILNDQYADGTDISWIWDVDFEPIGDPGREINKIVTSGRRADDMAVRLKYAGVDPQLMEVVHEVEAAFDRSLEATPQGAELYVLPTYTAMLALRDMFSRRGYTQQFWEGKKRQ